jgi:tripartite ATP-independent transporter DctP family solute receptor
MQRFKQQVEQHSQGRLHVDVYHTGQLGNTEQILEMVYNGAIEVAVPGAAELEAYVPEIGVISLPYIWRSNEYLFKTLDGELGRLLDNRLGKMNFHAISWLENGFRCITNDRQPITSPEDVRGLKIRVLPSPVVMSYFKAIGAAPVHVDWVELYEALKMGVVDAQENPPFFVGLGRFYEVQRYYSLTYHMNEPGVAVMNRAFYDRLPPALQGIVDEEALAAAVWQRQEMDRDNAEMLAQIKASGTCEINELSEEALDRFRRIAYEQVYPRVIEKKLCGPDTEELIDRVLRQQGLGTLQTLLNRP